MDEIDHTNAIEQMGEVDHINGVELIKKWEWIWMN
jgi:hypothetical protein